MTSAALPATDTSALVVTAERVLEPAADGPRVRYRDPALRIDERALGRLDSGNVRVRMRFVGICGSDLGVVSRDERTGFVTGSAPLEIGAGGRVLGHEGVGQVLESGELVRGAFEAGTWVGLESLLPCGRCPTCALGAPNECPDATLLGLQRDGLFAEVADVPAALVRPLGVVADSEEGRIAAVCLEPVACSLRALRAAALRPGQSVVVFGAGPIGAAAALLARRVFGAARVRVVEPTELRRERSAEWAHEVMAPEDYFRRTAGTAEDVLIEASGELGNVTRALPRMAPRGRVVLMGRSGAPLVVTDVDHLISANVSIVGCRGHAGGPVADVLALLERGDLPLRRLVTGMLDGLGALRAALSEPRDVVQNHCKLVARL